MKVISKMWGWLNLAPINLRYIFFHVQVASQINPYALFSISGRGWWLIEHFIMVFLEAEVQFQVK